MLFEDYYTPSFKTNQQKEKASFFTSVINGNGNIVANGHFEFCEEKKEKFEDSSNTKGEAFSSFFDGYTREEKEKCRDVQLWSVSPNVMSFDELASAHLQKHGLSAKSTATGQPQFSSTTVSGFATQNKTRAAEAQDTLERIDDLDTEVNNKCEDTIVIGVKKLSLQEKSQSSFSRVLCHKVGQCRKTHVFCDTRNELQCPPQIKPFDFSTPSPDDIVRSNQKLRK